MAEPPLMTGPLLSVRGLAMHYATRAGMVKAVDGVSFEVARGESLGLVGESGCGKTSIGLSLLRVLPDNGRIVGGSAVMDRTDLMALAEEEMRQWRWRRISMVFQAALSSLSPVHRVGAQIAEVLQLHLGLGRPQARERVAELLRQVGLEPSLAHRYPHELSGGMKQRSVIALALACEPDLVIADEPTTALDVIAQGQVLEEMRRIQQMMGTSTVYISHDIGVVAQVSQRIAVMYAGKIVEVGRTEDLLQRPRHPYTKALLASFPRLRGPKRPLEMVPGEAPNLLAPPAGCRFHPRCPFATLVCQEQEPPLESVGTQHAAACWHPLEASDKARS